MLFGRCEACLRVGWVCTSLLMLSASPPAGKAACCLSARAQETPPSAGDAAIGAVRATAAVRVTGSLAETHHDVCSSWPGVRKIAGDAAAIGAAAMERAALSGHHQRRSAAAGALPMPRRTSGLRRGVPPRCCRRGGGRELLDCTAPPTPPPLDQPNHTHPHAPRAAHAHIHPLPVATPGLPPSARPSSARPWYPLQPHLVP